MPDLDFSDLIPEQASSATPPSASLPPVAIPRTASGDVSFDDLIPGRQPAAPVPSSTAAAAPTQSIPRSANGDLSFSDLIPPPPSTAADVGRSALSGLAKGALGVVTAPVALPKTAADWLVESGDWLARKAFGLGPPSQTTLSAQARAQAEMPNIGVDRPVAAATAALNAALPTPQTTAGRYAETAASFIPNVAAMPGNAAVNAARMGVAGLASEGAGQAAQGTGYEAPARIAGAVVGGALGGGLSRVITPFPASPERQAMVDTLNQEGVPLTAGQVTGSRPLRYAESVLSDTPGAGGRAEAIDEAQKAAFTRAALQRIGIDAEHATPDVLQGARDAIGQTFNTLSARNTATFDPQFGHDIGNVLSTYDSMTLPNQQAPIVQQTLDGFAQLGGSMPGTQYQAVRSNLDKAARSLTISNPPLSDALFGFRNALDGAMTRSISPDDAAAWAEARNQWRNWKVIQQAATGAGENAAQGNISPAALRSAAVGQNRGAYATGQGDFADLARAGVGIMSPLPNSGTAPRMMVQHLANAGGAIAGALVGGLTHGAAGGTEGLLAGEALSPAGPSVLGRLLMSRPMQAYLSNQVLGGASRPMSSLDRLLLTNSARNALPAPAQ